MSGEPQRRCRKCGRRLPKNNHHLRWYCDNQCAGMPTAQTMTTFRMDTSLLKQITDDAAREGISRSEWLRQAALTRLSR